MRDDRDATGSADEPARNDASEDDDAEGRPIRQNVQDEPQNMDARGVPDPADPQAGMIVEDDGDAPEAARDRDPRVGDPIGL